MPTIKKNGVTRTISVTQWNLMPESAKAMWEICDIKENYIPIELVKDEMAIEVEVYKKARRKRNENKK
jgi:hypothetical protein